MVVKGLDKMRLDRIGGRERERERAQKNSSEDRNGGDNDDVSQNRTEHSTIKQISLQRRSNVF